MLNPSAQAPTLSTVVRTPITSIDRLLEGSDRVQRTFPSASRGVCEIRFGWKEPTSEFRDIEIFRFVWI